MKANICSFQGLISITESKIYDDSDFPNIKQGLIKGEYEFFEDPIQKGSGTFKGKFQSDFYIDSKGTIKYNDLRSSSDGFYNNQFEGLWINYKPNDSKKCNWGDYRIPDSEKLDNGVSEFVPTDEYLKYDWDNYRILFSGNSDDKKVIEARKKENIKWWIDKE